MWLALEKSGALTRRYLKLPDGVSEDEFLAYIMLPDGGTVGEWVGPQLQDAYDPAKRLMPRTLQLALPERSGAA